MTGGDGKWKTEDGKAFPASRLPSPVSRHFGLRNYTEVFAEQRAFTDARSDDTPDELWFLQHHPVFTQGQAGKAEHLLTPGDIPVVQSDRGGQVTYHGPGQLVVYFLLDLRRLGYGIRSLVTRLETALIETLSGYGIEANSRRDAPGVYVNGAKIASLGLRVRRGCSYHGIALNVDMDLEPFTRINPCGYQGLRMTQLGDLGGPKNLAAVSAALQARLLVQLAASSTGS